MHRYARAASKPTVVRSTWEPHEACSRSRRRLPGTKYASGVTFLKNQWTPLTHFLDHPIIPLDNREAERRIWGPVVGRKNFAGSRSEQGAHVAELLYSLLHSGVMEGVDPDAYLIAAVTTAMENRKSILLPHEYAAQQPS